MTETPKQERDYLKAEIWQIINSRYSNLQIYDAIAVLEVIKHELLAVTPTTTDPT